MNLTSLTATQLAQRIRSKEISAVEVTEAFVENIRRQDPALKAFVTVLEKEALDQAHAVDQKISQGYPTLGSLAGVPIAIKDNLAIQGTRTTCSSKILENFVATYNATVIERLKKADAIFVGKTNLDEFAMGSSTENSAFFTTKNPWDLSRIPGGSSGGSACAVAGSMAPLALGSDTGGSIRQPAACCGVVGLKPTYGRLSRFGLVAFASSLDQIGPFAKTAEDIALVMEVLSGHDRRDSTSADVPVPAYSQELKNGIGGLRIGLPKEYFVSGLDAEVEKAVRTAVSVLESEGAKIQEISLPHTSYAIDVYYVLAPSEASSNLARYDGIRYGYRSTQAGNLLETFEFSRGQGLGPEVKRRIMLGTYALSAGYYEAYYGKAQKVRTLIKQDFDKAFESVDLIATPTTPTPAFKIGEKTGDPLQMYLSDIFTISCNLAGIPGISIPCGFSSNNLPLGLQLLGRPFGESTLLQASYVYQQKTTWHKKAPPAHS